MAVTLRDQKTAYDNIAVGAATGTERTINGSAPPSQTYAQGENVVVGEALSEPNMTTAVDFPDELLTP